MTKETTQFQLGAHMSAAGGVFNALHIAQKAKCTAVQLFSANQKTWQPKELSQEVIAEYKKVYKACDITTTVVHASYLINLCSTNLETLAKSKVAIGKELARCDQLGIDYCVLHPGAHTGAGEAAGLNLIVKSLDEVFKKNKYKVKLLLETTAGQGTCLGHSFEQLGYILAHVKNPEALGVCLDTCHIFAAGYDFRTASLHKETFKAFDKHVGLSNLKVLHLNDSKGELGSHLDRHEKIGEGNIGRAGFVNIMTDKRLTKLPLILETPKGVDEKGKDLDLINMATLRRYAKATPK